MRDLDVGQLARSMGLSEAELMLKLAASGIPTDGGHIKLPEGVSLADSLARRPWPRVRDIAADSEQEALKELERDNPLSDTAAKAVELGRRVAHDMAHPSVAGPHVLIGLTLVADSTLSEIPELGDVSRRALRDAVGGSDKLSDEWLFFKDRRTTLSEILGRARKAATGDRVDAADLLTAVLSDPITSKVLGEAGVDVGKLESELRAACS